MKKEKLPGIANGLLEKAAENAGQLITNFLHGTEDYSDYTIQFNRCMISETRPAPNGILSIKIPLRHRRGI